MKSRVYENKLFSKLVKNYYNRVYKTALFYMKNKFDAEDITQDVFIKAFEKIDFSKTDKSKFPILFIMAKNLSLNKLKSRSYKNEAIPQWELLSYYYNPEDEYIKSEELNSINISLNKLKPDDREVLILKHYQDCSYKEISEILNIPIGTVMSRLYSARKKMGQNLKGVVYDK